MIFLPPVHIWPEKSLPIDHAKFILGNLLYFMHCDSHIQNDSKMKSVDLRTFKVSSVEGVDARVPSAYEPVVVRRGKAYFWDYIDNFLLEGKIDEACFYWRKINAIGHKPPTGASLGYDDGSGDVLCVLSEGSADETLSLYRLDLSTFVWTRQGMNITHELIIAELRNFRLWLYPWATFVAGQRVHFIRAKGRSHLIFDQTTLEWSFDEAVSPNRLFWTDGSHLCMLGKDKDIPRNRSNVSRFDCAEMKWHQVAQIADVYRLDHSKYDCFKIGSRIVIVEGYRHRRRWVKTILLVELDPTLFDLTSTALRRNPEITRMARRVLPRKIIDELIIRRVLNENKESDDGETPHKRPRLTKD